MNLLLTYWSLLKITAYWLVISFILCGLLHIVLRPELLQKTLGNKKISSLIKATISGMLLPICSCGVVPLSLSLYHSGAYLGPTLAFLVATPIINPAALILAFALLGPKIAIIYLISGFLLPFIVGCIGNRFGGKETVSPYAQYTEPDTFNEQRKIVSVKEKAKLQQKIMSGFQWGFQSLGLQVSRFVIVGVLFAAVILVVIPVPWIQSYLSRPDMISLVGITLLGAGMYVCALGHIPFIAALLASGAAPGVALTFLLSGVATNFPEMISIAKLIGKRAVLIYTGSVICLGIIIGYITNSLLMPGFVPIFDLTAVKGTIDFANSLSLDVPEWIETVCAFIVIGMGLFAWFSSFNKWYRNRMSLERSHEM